MDKKKLRKRILTDWLAIDKLLFENKKPNRFSPAYSKYIVAKGQIISETYRLKRLMGQSIEAILETYDTPQKESSEMIKTAEQILIDIGRKNSFLAESLVLSKKEDVRKARLEAMLLGECLLNESRINKLSNSVGFQIKRQVFESLVDMLVSLAQEC